MTLLVPEFAATWGGGRKIQESPVQVLTARHERQELRFFPLFTRNWSCSISPSQAWREGNVATTGTR